MDAAQAALVDKFANDMDAALHPAPAADLPRTTRHRSTARASARARSTLWWHARRGPAAGRRGQRPQRAPMTCRCPRRSPPPGRRSALPFPAENGLRTLARTTLAKLQFASAGRSDGNVAGKGITAAAPYSFYETSLLDFSNETKRQVPCALEPCPAPKGPRPRRAERASCTPVSSRCVCTARLRRAGPGVRALWCILASRRLLPGVGARM